MLQFRRFLSRGDEPSTPEQIAESLKDWSQKEVLDVIFQNHPGLVRKKIKTGDFENEYHHLHSGYLLELHSGQLVMFIGLNNGFFQDPKLKGSIIAEIVVDKERRKAPHSLIVTNVGNIKTYYGKDGRPENSDRLIG